MEKQACTPVGTPSRYVAAASSSPYPLPSPSPFALSIASTAAVSTKPPILHIFDLILRALALLLSLVAVLVLALTASPTGNGEHRGNRCPSFTRSSSYWYAVSAAFLCLLYAALQLFKGIMEFALKGLIPEKFLDYAGFVIDQLMAYLLLSSSSILVYATMDGLTDNCKKSAKASVVASSLCFLVVALSALLSGYKLGKRLIW